MLNIWVKRIRMKCQRMLLTSWKSPLSYWFFKLFSNYSFLIQLNEYRKVMQISGNSLTRTSWTPLFKWHGLKPSLLIQIATAKFWNTIIATMTSRSQCSLRTYSVFSWQLKATNWPDYLHAAGFERLTITGGSFNWSPVKIQKFWMWKCSKSGSASPQKLCSCVLLVEPIVRITASLH